MYGFVFAWLSDLWHSVALCFAWLPDLWLTIAWLPNVVSENLPELTRAAAGGGL